MNTLFTHWLRHLLLIAIVVACLPTQTNAQTYTPPVNPRADLNLNPGWLFIRQDAPGAQNKFFDDSTWTTLNLPHTWNNLDGQDGGNNYYRGIGWYRLHYAVDGSYTNRRFFLKFDGAFYVTDVYVNGTLLGEHQGGFGAFIFEVTTNLIVGGDNVIAVKVSNAPNSSIPPLSADFTFFGGIYRDVHLIVTDPLQISPMDYASPGVYVRPTNVSSNSANLQVTTLVSNANPVTATVTVRTVVTDAATNVVTILTNTVSLPPGAVSSVIASTVITNEHLWNGLADPYLYQIFVEVYNGPNLTDLVSQPLGFRWYKVDPNTGFFLNGRPYDLHGVDMHQDWINCGWALTNAQRATNFAIMKDLGVTAMRLAHYQHDDFTYQLADRAGIILWSEIPLVNSTTETTNFYNNAKQQLRELIRQRYNHPAVVCWGMYNELSLGVNTAPTNLVNQLVQLEVQEDPTRPSTGAVLASTTGDNNAWYPQLIAFNEYYAWYETPTNFFGTWADNLHAARPTNCIGVSEYGAGASIYQHSENPVAQPATAGPFHPEEWQNYVHEITYAAMKARPFIWCKFIWNGFDFASDGRSEGDTIGRNDKGLTTYDRLVHKDIYYFYKANWTTDPMVYITGHTFTNRLTNFVTARVYANCDSVELFVNGASQGIHLNTNFIFTWPVALGGGSNSVQAVGTKGGTNVSDALSWFTPVPPPVVSVVAPMGGVALLGGTNSALLVSVTVSNPAPLNPLATTWAWSGGPGVVTFGNSNVPATTASFSSNGVYALNFTAYNGAATNVSVLVVVNTDSSVTNGLAAWWKMDEPSGAIAKDSSTNNRSASVVNGIFTNGFVSRALLLTNATSRATYTAVQSNQVTVAAWVRCDTTGGGTFPRIVETPSYRFFFRFSSGAPDINSVAFATLDSVNGDFDSGAGSISLGTWYHVAASYDRNSSPTQPTFYINGKKVPTTVLTPPSGSIPPFSGTGYIGNSAASNRNWAGLIDDLRIYDRLLSDTEILVLAANPPTNVAPVVFAGTNQTIVWPASANLAGNASDDGKPNPPGAISIAWNQVSGPGSVTFGNSNTAATSASFSSAGNYLLRLVVDDGQAKTASDVDIAAVVRPAVQAALLGGTLQLSWDNSVSGWHLQAQAAALGAGLGTNWVDVPGSDTTNQFNLLPDPNRPAIFYRLVSPF